MFGDELNSAQEQAVTHGDGPLLVLAGAGTGKTRTVAARVDYLLQRGVAPERICLLTFSRRAAAEMLARTGPAGRRVCGGTFHSVAHRFLRRHGALAGLGPSFTVLDAADSVELLGLVRHDIGRTAERRPGQRRFPSPATLAGIASRVVNTGERLADVVTQRYPWCQDELDDVRTCLAGYTARKRAHATLDLDDLLLFWRALAQTPAGGEATARAFDHVLVDEYQDTNQLQADICDLLAPGGHGLTVVGDDAQAIYGFRAATPRNILDFDVTHPGTTVVRLEQNYRSTPVILAVANAVMAGAPAHHAAVKQLRAVRQGRRRPLLRTCADEATQAREVCDSVLRHRDEGSDLRGQAVLFRTGHHADALELELTRRNVPFVKFGGLKFLEAAHVKDLLALLRVLENPSDELAWFRVLQLLDGVGPATARRVLDDLFASAASDFGAPSALAQLLAAAPAVPSSAREPMGALRTALSACVEVGDEPAAQIGCLRAFLGPIIERRYDSPESRQADVVELERMASNAPSRSAFLVDLTLDPPTSTGDLAGSPHLDDDWLTLSTIHSAKGGEWDVVHLIHAADGCLPSDMATGNAEELAEERRLVYVACTRARNALEVSWPLRYHHRRGEGGLGDAHSYAQLCRFFDGSVLAHFDAVSATPPALPEPAPFGVTASVDALLEDLWT